MASEYTAQLMDELEITIDNMFDRFHEKYHIENGGLDPQILNRIADARQQLAEAISDGMEWQEMFCKHTHYYPTYAPEADITFILKRIYQNGCLLDERISGYYYGEPTDCQTDKYKESGAVAKLD